jgi:hypothetical protein
MAVKALKLEVTPVGCSSWREALPVAELNGRQGIETGVQLRVLSPQHAVVSQS